MKTVKLSGSSRANVGKKEAKLARKQGMVPAVIYGGENQTHFTVDEIAAKKLVFTPDVYKVDLELEGKTQQCIIQEVQFHPITDSIIHMDFLELSDNKPVKIKLPVRISGNSIGVRNGGRLAINFRKLAVYGLPSAFPEAVEVDITELKIGDAIRVSDLSIDGVKFLDPANAVVVAVKMARGAVAEEEEAEGEEGAEGGEAAAEA